MFYLEAFRANTCEPEHRQDFGLPQNERKTETSPGITDVKIIVDADLLILLDVHHGHHAHDVTEVAGLPAAVWPTTVVDGRIDQEQLLSVGEHREAT